MKPRLSSIVPLSCLLAAFAFAATAPANAQDQSATANHRLPPNILVVNTEFVKPGQAGSPHMKTEAAFVQAAREGHSKDHYFGLDSLTGRQRAVFFHLFSSFADWQQTTQADMQNASLASSLDSNFTADGALLDEYMTSVYHFRKDLSLNPGADIGKTRYFELTLFKVRSGHEADWPKLVKMFRDADAKIPGEHWDMFEKMYGNNTSGTWLLAVPMQSLSEVDVNMTNDSKLKDAVGADQFQKMMDLANSTVESVESNLFAINPKMSYMDTAVTKEDPQFWGE